MCQICEEEVHVYHLRKFNSLVQCLNSYPDSCVFVIVFAPTRNFDTTQSFLTSANFSSLNLAARFAPIIRLSMRACASEVALG